MLMTVLSFNVSHRRVKSADKSAVTALPVPSAIPAQPLPEGSRRPAIREERDKDWCDRSSFSHQLHYCIVLYINTVLLVRVHTVHIVCTCSIL